MKGRIMSNTKIMKRQFVFDMSYDEMLKSYSMTDLKEIGKTWGLKGLTKYKKNELTEVILKHILENLENRFNMFNLDHLTIIVELTKGSNVFSKYPIAAEELLALGLILEGKLADEKQVVMPNVLFERFKAFYDVHHETLTFNTIIKDYMDLTTSLYGVLSVDMFVESFYEFNEEAIEKDVIEACVLHTSTRTQNSVLENDMLHYYRLSESEKVYKDIQTRDDISYQKIDHTMLQTFIQNGYTLWSETHDRLQEVLEKSFNGSRETTLDVIDELRVMLSYNHGISDFIQLFSKKNGTSDMVALKDFADVIVSLNNEIAHWELKGHAPHEFSTIKKQMPIIKGDKIQRNDPCPCGSGKKYKKCCINKVN